jgi:hypothetical protein
MIAKARPVKPDRRLFDDKLAGLLPVRQSPIGRATMSAEFCNVPRLRISPLSWVIIRPSSMLSLSTSDRVNATDPTEIAPASQRSIAKAAIAAIMMPDSAASDARTPVRCRVNGMMVAMNWSNPSRI